MRCHEFLIFSHAIINPTNLRYTSESSISGSATLLAPKSMGSPDRVDEVEWMQVSKWSFRNGTTLTGLNFMNIMTHDCLSMMNSDDYYFKRNNKSIKTISSFPGEPSTVHVLARSIRVVDVQGAFAIISTHLRKCRLAQFRCQARQAGVAINGEQRAMHKFHRILQQEASMTTSHHHWPKDDGCKLSLRTWTLRKQSHCSGPILN